MWAPGTAAPRGAARGLLRPTTLSYLQAINIQRPLCQPARLSPHRLAAPLNERYQPRYSLGSILTIRSRTPPEKQDWPFRAFTRACVSCIHHCTSAPRDHDFTVTAGGARSAGVTACTSTSRPLRRSTRGPTVGVAPRGEIAENRNRAARSKRPPRSRA